MKNKNKKTAKKASSKTKPKKPFKKGKTNYPVQKAGKPKPSPAPAPVHETAEVKVAAAREGAGFKISIDGIGGSTIIGDLIVVFPRTREVLQKRGLRLDVEEAGDIYMTLDAFAALQGLSTKALILELEEAAKAPPPQPPPLVTQLATPPATA